jgi:hypothetical protein
MHLKTYQDYYISSKDTLAATFVWLAFVFPPHPSLSLCFHIKYNLLGKVCGNERAEKEERTKLNGKKRKGKKKERLTIICSGL